MFLLCVYREKTATFIRKEKSRRIFVLRLKKISELFINYTTENTAQRLAQLAIRLGQ